MQDSARLVILRDGKTSTLSEQPFVPEEKLEFFVYQHPEALGNVTILERQSGTRQDRPDLIGVDGDGNVLVIEVKDEAATYDVVSQVLRYALWAQNNPDSIRVLWSRLDRNPGVKEPNWDDVTVRIIVVAPDFEQSVLKATSAIRYPTSLVQVTRFATDNSDFVVVRDLRFDGQGEGSPVRVRGNYSDPKWHREEMGRNAQSIQSYFEIAREIQKLCSSRQWSLDAKFNQSDMSMKLGSHVAFGVGWDTTKSLYLFFHYVPTNLQKKFKRAGLDRSDNPSYSWLPIGEKGVDVARLNALFQAAYEGTRRKYGT